LPNGKIELDRFLASARSGVDGIRAPSIAPLPIFSAAELTESTSGARLKAATSDLGSMVEVVILVRKPQFNRWKRNQTAELD